MVIGPVKHAASSAWTRIPARYPFAFGVFISTFKTSFADLLVQKVVERKEKVDWRRNAAFASFGFFYLGGVQYMIYVPLFGRIFPQAATFAAKSLREKAKDIRGIFNVAAQVFLDQCIHHPLMYFPAFYMTREIVMSPNPDIKRVLQEYRKNMWDDLKALWKIWVPTTCLNFAFMPMWARIPWVAGTSLVWTCILSAMRGGDVSHGQDMAGGAVTKVTLHLMEEGYEALFNHPVELESDKNHVMISASGQDKVGWVALLSGAVAEAGGNITHSKMVRLGTEFIVLMHTSVEPENLRSLMEALKKNDDLKGLNVRASTISRRHTGTYDPAITGIRLRARGADQPYLLASLSAALAERNISIENISTDVSWNKEGHKDFHINADCVVTTYMEPDQVVAMVSELNQLKEQLNLDTVDVRVQRLAAGKSS